MKLIRITTVVLMIITLLLANVSPALALPPLPSTFSGTVLVNGVGSPAGTLISAWINGVKYAEVPVTIYLGVTYYGIDVPGDDPATSGIIEGGTQLQTIVFQIGTLVAQQTGSWQSGNPQSLNLTAVSAPTDISLSPTSVAENSAINTTVGALTATDPSAGETFTYTLVSGAGSTDNASFNILGANLRTSAVFDYETKNSYSVRIRVTDSELLWYEEAFTISVTNVNEAPVVTDIPNQTIAEGASFVTIALDGYVSDVDNTDAEMTWTYSGNTALTVSINASRVATITIPNVDWTGAETITFRATDPGALFSSDPATFTVTAVNDAPVVTNIPNQTIAEGASFVTIALDGYVSDVDNTDAEMTWTYSGNTALTVSINASRVATITIPSVDWNGSEIITFRATDPGALFSSDPATFTVTAVNDAPVVTDIPNQTIAEGASFVTIALDGYVSDVDNTDAEMTWTYSGNTALTVSINASRVATITIPNADWNGAETITFRATDPGALFSSDPATFTVTAVNDAPVVTDIPSQTIAEGASFVTIALDGYVSDVDNTDAEMTWTYSGNTALTVSINASRVATITIPNADWNGNETITFRATDPGALFSSDPATFTVTAANDAPVVTDIPSQTIAEGASFVTIALDGYVSDVDNTDAEMTWTYSGNTALTVSINASRVATITIPNADWNGAETITFRATDPGALFSSDPATFTVTAVNDAPTDISLSPSTVAENLAINTVVGAFNAFDPDAGDTFTYTLVTGTGDTGNGSFNILGTNLRTSAIFNFEAQNSYSIRVRVTDLGGLTYEEAFTITVTNVNEAPVVTDIPSQTIAEGASFVTIALDGYVSDVDNTDAEMTWTYSGNTALTVSINASRVATITIPSVDWNGAETITFRATDPGALFSSDPATFTVTAVNDAPVVTDIPNQTIAEGASFVTIALDGYVSDVDNTDAEMTWTYSGNTALTVSINASRVATITIPNADWNGNETITFRATDPGALFSSDPATFTVTAVNDAPVVTDIPNQTIAEGASFVTIALDGYVSDVDNTDAEMTWTYSGNTALTVSINASRVATITIPNADWNGNETITFRATDPGALFSSDPATFTVTAVNDAPVVTDIPNQTIAEGASFVTIALDGYVSDVDNTDAEMTWTYSGNTALTVSINASRVATITIPNADWNGTETITFRATDPGALFSSDPATFTVTAVNDAPVVTDIPNQTIAEGASFVTIALDGYVSDVDNTDAEMTWTYSGNTALTVSINASRVATITIPNADWNGAETITFRATDPGALFSSDPATFTVTAVNDAPVVTDIPNQTIAEGASFVTIALDGYVSDVDNTDAEMTWTYSGNTALTVSINASRVATITIPNADWNGSEIITFRATDPGALFSSDPATFTVTAVNDTPTDITLSNSTVAENLAINSVVGAFTAADPDAGDTFTYTLVVGTGDTGNGSFNILSGNLRTSAIFNYEAQNSYSIRVRVTDLAGAFYEEAFTISITNVNEAPVVTDIPSQTIAEGASFVTIALDGYVSDVDNTDAEMTWTYSGNTALTVSINASRVATITIPNADWNGNETITFRATDPGALFSSDPATFTVTAVNDAPVVTDIPSQTIAEGASFVTIALDGYVSDVDNTDAEMTWTYSGNTALTVSINASRVATITIPNADWNGDETITFRATDPGALFSSDPATFTVTAVNDAPVVTDIPNQTIAEGASFVTIALDGYVSDVDNTDAEMTWTYSGNTALTVSINASRVATITIPNADWNGAETITFRATDPGALFSSDPATFTVTAVNDAPVVTDIPSQTIAEGASFVTIALDGYVSDVDNTDAEMTWTYSGNTALTVSINASRVATITIPNADWNGNETITFRATDPGLLFDDDPATFTVSAVNDAPVVTDIPNQTIAEGASFVTIALDGYVSDVDNTDAEMTWTYSGNTALTVSINASRVATITIPNADWNGNETITFRATDPGALFSSNPATFTVTAVNDAPVVTDIPNQTIAEGASFVTIALDGYVSDVDNTDAEMTWTYSGNTALTVSINASRVATITIPNADWNGTETITFRATDPGLLFRR